MTNEARVVYLPDSDSPIHIEPPANKGELIPQSAVVFQLPCQEHPGVPPCDYPPARTLDSLSLPSSQALETCKGCPKLGPPPEKGLSERVQEARFTGILSRLSKS